MKKAHPSRPASLSRYRGAWLVFLGGALGTLVRYLIDAFFEPVAGLAVDILLINLAGAFLLALVVGRITGVGTPTAQQMRFRLFFGTGAMGGFTTYSTLAFHVASLGDQGRWGAGLAYALTTLLMGAALSFLGLGVGRFWARWRIVERVEDDE